MHKPRSSPKWILLVACSIGACGGGQYRPDHPAEAGGGDFQEQDGGYDSELAVDVAAGEEQDSGYDSELAVDVAGGEDAEPGVDGTTSQDLGGDGFETPDSDVASQDAGDETSKCGDASCGSGQTCAVVGNYCRPPRGPYQCDPGLVFQYSSPPCCVPPIWERCADIDLPCEDQLTCSCFSTDPCPAGTCFGGAWGGSAILCLMP